MHWLAAWAVAWVLAATQSAPGAVQVFTDRVAFEASLANRSTFSFEVEDGFPAGFPDGPARLSSLGGGRIELTTSIGDPAEVFPLPLPAELGQGLTPDVTFGFSETVHGFGSDYYTVGTDALLTLGFDGAPDLSYYLIDYSQPRAGTPFLGFITDEPLLRVTIDPLGGRGGITVHMGPIDNVTVGVVPEPVCLGPAAVAACSICRRRRRRASAEMMTSD